jgi:sulfotransferase
VIYFLSGMPRSGSTLLSNILLQNPDMYVTATSGLIDVVRTVRDICDKNSLFQAIPHDERDQVKLDMLRGVIAARFRQHEGKCCFDKSRGWPTIFELVENLFGSREAVKAIICVRDLRDILASFEKLYRKTLKSSSTTQEAGDFIAHRTALGRAEFIMRDKEPVGYSMDVVRDAVTRGWRDVMHFVDYDELCRNPEKVLEKIYLFVGKPIFKHNFDRVEQVTVEDDTFHGFVGLHDIRSDVKPQRSQWPLVFDRAVTATPFWARVTEGARWWEHMG